MYLAVVGAVGQVADIAMAIHSVRPDLTDVFFVIADDGPTSDG